MMNRKKMIQAAVLFAVFLIFTVLVKTVDVAPVGPEGSSVGFSGINAAFHNLTGYSPFLYKLTTYAGYLAFAAAAGFAALLCMQFVRGKSLRAVDRDLYALLGLYVAVAVCYVVFEKVIINYRPVILDPAKGLAASYPSTHTLIAIGILVPAMGQCQRRIKNPAMKKTAVVFAALLLCLIVIGRLFSGVHWLTDIMGGCLLGAALYRMYSACAGD